MQTRALIDASEEATGRQPDRGRTFEAATDVVRAAPGTGTVVAIVVRPSRDRREAVDTCELSEREGVVGDDWLARGSRSQPKGRANPECQVTLMSTRVLEAIEPDRARWPLAGDQLLVDLDLSEPGLPDGTRLAVGTAVLEVSAVPHTGCAKFSARFGSDALRWINSPEGRLLRMRGVNARIVVGGTVRVGDAIRPA